MAAIAVAIAAVPTDPMTLLHRLNAELLATRSATATLERWCADRGLSDPPRVRAEVERGGAPVAPNSVRRALKVGRRDMLGFRRVRLMCGPYVMSDATNWYVRARLTPAMNAALDGSDTPFGRIIRPMSPHRRTLSARTLWNGRGAVPGTILRHRAMVVDPRGNPIAQVVESYRDALVMPVPSRR